MNGGVIYSVLLSLTTTQVEKGKWLQEPFRGCEPDGRSAETVPLYLFVTHNIDGIR